MLKNKKIVLSLDDRKKLAAFFELLIQVDKRIKAEKDKSKRQKVKLKNRDMGPPIRGPFLFERLVFIDN